MRKYIPYAIVAAILTVLVAAYVRSNLAKPESGLEPPNVAVAAYPTPFGGAVYGPSLDSVYRWALFDRTGIRMNRFRPAEADKAEAPSEAAGDSDRGKIKWASAEDFIGPAREEMARRHAKEIALGDLIAVLLLAAVLLALAVRSFAGEGRRPSP